MNFQTARAMMVEAQIRPNGVRDPRILNAFADIPRELFVPESQKALAYIDEALPIPQQKKGASPRYLLPPMILARLVQYAEPCPSDTALDVGGVTGYSAAILKQLCDKVFALEASAGLAEQAGECLTKAGIKDVAVEAGDLNLGLPSRKPYNVILVNGGVAEEPRPLFEQLADGGRLVTIIGDRLHGHAYLFTKTGNAVSGRPVFDVSAEILPGFEAEPHFVF